MSIIMRKKKKEVIKKVNIKMACDCNPSHYTCGCECLGTSALADSYGREEAAECGKVYFYEKNPPTNS